MSLVGISLKSLHSDGSYEKNACRIEHFRQRHVEDKDENEALHGLEVGDILASSWGRYQTNVDFYQVVKVAGTTRVVIREIAKKVIEINRETMSGHAIAEPHAFIGSSIRKATRKPYFFINKYSCAEKWGTVKDPGEPQYISWCD